MKRGLNVQLEGTIATDVTLGVGKEGCSKKPGIVTGERSSILKKPKVPFCGRGCTLKIATTAQLQFLADFSLSSLVKTLGNSHCSPYPKPEPLLQICSDIGIALVPPKLAVMHLVPSSSDPETAHSLN